MGFWAIFDLQMIVINFGMSGVLLNVTSLVKFGDLG
jgi:hypothetical protein